MNANPKTELTLKAAAVASSAAGSWREFVEEFRRFAEDKRDKCMTAPLDTVGAVQGEARVCFELLTLFDGAVKTANSINERRR